MKPISTSEAPTPAGHYSQAVVAVGVMYLSGQLPIDPATGKPVLGEIEDQTRLVFKNLRAVLRARGLDLQHVVRVTVYVSDVALWPRVNAVYAEIFGDHRPARTVVPSGLLHYGALIEADAIAVLA